MRRTLIMLVGVIACASPESQPEWQEGTLSTPDGVRIYYRSVGSGAQTVVVPAGLYLEPFLEPLAATRRIIFFDPAGRGRSDPVDTTRATFEQTVRDFEAVREALGLERMALIGWSGLGKEAAVYTSRYPDRVTRLVQISPVGPRSDPYPQESGVMSRADRMDLDAIDDLERRRNAGEFDGRSAELCRAASRLTMPANFVDTSLASRVPDVCRYENEWLENINPYFRGIMGSQGTYDWRDSIRAAGVPRLVIHGREDPIPIAGGRDWVRGDPNARFLEISPAGHFPFLEQADTVLAAIDRFLEGGWPSGAVTVPADSGGG